MRSSLFLRSDSRPWARACFHPLVAGLVAFTCSACGADRNDSRESSPRTGSPATVDVCELVTREEVARVMQVPMREPQEQVISAAAADRAGIAQCTYLAADAPAHSVAVFLRQSPARDNDPAAIRTTLETAGVSISEVAGVGDAAFWDGAKLHVFHDGYFYLTVAVSGRESETQGREAAIALARTAVDRLPSR